MVKLAHPFVWGSLLALPLVNTSALLPHSDKVLVNVGITTLNIGEREISSIKDFSVDNHGHMWITDALRRVVLKFGKDGSLLMTIDRFANQSRFKRPFGLFIDKQDNVYVADAAASRVYVFTNDGKPIRTMEVKHDLQTLRINSKGELIIGGFNGEAFPRNGFYLSRYNPSHSLTGRFEPADEKLVRLNLSYFEGILFDLDRDDNIYCVQPVTYKVKKYNRQGRLLGVISGTRRHYRPPPSLPEETFKDKQKFSAWMRSWTPVVGLHVLKKKRSAACSVHGAGRQILVGHLSVGWQASLYGDFNAIPSSGH